MRRNKFSLSHYKLFSCDMGELIPCGLVEVLPGDTFEHSTTALVRASPLLAPIMHPVDVRIHHWFVPHRLIWSEWEDFITGGPAGTSAPALPTVTTTGYGAGELADYLGVWLNTTYTHSMLPFRGYAMIWNEWYRDQDLQAELPISLASGTDSTTSRTLQRVNWEKDYFTSARPWEQKGPSVSVPLGSFAPVIGLASDTVAGSFPLTSAGATYKDSKGTTNATGNWSTANIGNPDAGGVNVRLRGDNATGFPSIHADLSAATAATANTWRQAFAIQRFMEMRGRYGSRYSEMLRAWGVRSSDARLQRPEYLGGGRNTIQFSEVLQTGQDQTTTPNPIGTMRGHGISATRSNRYRKFFEEHGYVFTLLSVRPKTIYIQGHERHFNKRVKEDYWNPEFQHIGQQKVLNKEVYASHTTPDGTFGYQDRYDEYRRQESKVAAEFRTTLLNFWHMARDFTSDPALNSSFVTCTPTERVFAVPSQDNLYIMAKHKILARRLVAREGTSFLK